MLPTSLRTQHAPPQTFSILQLIILNFPDFHLIRSFRASPPSCFKLSPWFWLTQTTCDTTHNVQHESQQDSKFFPSNGFPQVTRLWYLCLMATLVSCNTNEHFSLFYLLLGSKTTPTYPHLGIEMKWETFPLYLFHLH